MIAAVKEFAARVALEAVFTVLAAAAMLAILRLSVWVFQ